jgi:hypothetical protein
VAYQLPSICRAGFIGGAGGCTGAGGIAGIEGPLLSWNDCELQAAMRHASRRASDVNPILTATRGIGPPEFVDSRVNSALDAA